MAIETVERKYRPDGPVSLRFTWRGGILVYLTAVLFGLTGFILLLLHLVLWLADAGSPWLLGASLTLLLLGQQSWPRVPKSWPSDIDPPRRHLDAPRDGTKVEYWSEDGKTGLFAHWEKGILITDGVMTPLQSQGGGSATTGVFFFLVIWLIALIVWWIRQ